VDLTKRKVAPWRIVESRKWEAFGGMLQGGSRLLEDTYPIPPGAPRVYLRERTLVLTLFNTLEITLRSRGKKP
jgi:hypothetical protein